MIAPCRGEHMQKCNGTNIYTHTQTHTHILTQNTHTHAHAHTNTFTHSRIRTHLINNRRNGAYNKRILYRTIKEYVLVFTTSVNVGIYYRSSNWY